MNTETVFFIYHKNAEILFSAMLLNISKSIITNTNQSDIDELTTFLSTNNIQFI